MSSPLPPELLDLVVDDLHDQRAALLACGLVSKSWILRARRHIFAHVVLGKLTIDSWMKAFPDPSDSPAHHTKYLAIISAQLVTAAGTDVGRWIRAFHNIVHLHVDTHNLRLDERLDDDGQVSFVPLHGISPTVKSLHLCSTSPRDSEVFGFLCSFPLLEDFTLDAFRPRIGAEEWETPLASPSLTGSLNLGGVDSGVGPIARRLLDLPGGLNFTKIVSAGACGDDFKATADLVSRCSGTTESLTISDCLLSGFPSTAALD